MRNLILILILTQISLNCKSFEKLTEIKDIQINKWNSVNKESEIELDNYSQNELPLIPDAFNELREILQREINYFKSDIKRWNSLNNIQSILPESYSINFNTDLFQKKAELKIKLLKLKKYYNEALLLESQKKYDKAYETYSHIKLVYPLLIYPIFINSRYINKDYADYQKYFELSKENQLKLETIDNNEFNKFKTKFLSISDLSKRISFCNEYENKFFIEKNLENYKSLKKSLEEEMDYLSLKTTIENMKNFQGKTYIQKISLLNKTCNSFTGKILNDKCKKIKQIFQTEFQKRHPRWIEPFDGINVDSDSYSEITDAISLAYNYDVVQKSPLCIYKFSKYESVEFRDIYCAGTAIDDYGRTSCRLFHINDFTQRLKISNNIDLGIGEKNCSKKALTQYKYYGFTGTVGICWFYNNSDKAKISGCYLLKDDFNINDEYKKSLKIK